ncbi:DUF1080 domain-containing protein [Candidatus Poribacteria bacterium]|nr:MAG: DUF1080 domain-containing protein [Candidatus Poribacteria bacterium]
MLHTPPESAVILFDGKDLSNWVGRDGGEPKWKVEGDAMIVEPRTGDISSKETFTDHFLHLEFMCPDMPEASGQAKGNSGVFFQGRYEIQVLDSYGIEVPGKGDCGAIYNQFAALVNACLPPLHWQTYDVIFRAPRFNDAGEMTENVRVTALQNGLVILNNVQLPGTTAGGADSAVAQPGPLRLQDHGNLVQYRNIWAVPLPLEGSDQY